MHRLAKIISNAGVCSRRDAEKLIVEGQIKVDGITILSPATNVDISNQIEVSGTLINNIHKQGFGFITNLLV